MSVTNSITNYFYPIQEVKSPSSSDGGRMSARTSSSLDTDFSSSPERDRKSVSFASVRIRFLGDGETHYSTPTSPRKAKGVKAHRINKLNYSKTNFRTFVKSHRYVKKLLSLDSSGSPVFSHRATKKKLTKASKRVRKIINFMKFRSLDDFQKERYLQKVLLMIDAKIAIL